MELSVGELAQVLGQSQPRVSRHVKILIDSGLVERRKEGSWVFLSLGRAERVEPLFTLLDRWESDRWRGSARASSDSARLAAVRSERAAAAERYFASHAADWDELRSLHIAESRGRGGDRPGARGPPESAAWSTSAPAPAGCSSCSAPEAEGALGVDRSPEMLRLARVKLAQAGLAADLRQGDMYALPLASGSADTVIIHQVLHYAQQPAAAVAEAARLLAPGGRLLIVDFAPHDREELRDRDAHARLGFSDEAMLKYLDSAGLEGRVVEHLEGGELTVTIWAGERPETRLKEVA